METIHYKDRINRTVRAFIDAQTEARKGWDDDVQKHYYHYYLEPMVSDAVKYDKMVDDLLDILYASKQKIDALVGDVKAFKADIQNIHER